MPATIRGKATIEGITGTVTYDAIVANGQLDPLSAEFSDQCDVQQRLDGNGLVRGFRKRNERKEVTVTCLCSVSAGNARADALKAVAFPAKLSVVTLAGFEDGHSPTALNGAYIYQGGGGLSYGDDYVRMTLPLMKYDHETSANLTAAVT
jgi:hypothetical protein